MGTQANTNRSRLPWPLAPTKRRHRHTAHFENVLGTSLELQISSGTPNAGPKAERAALREIDRLEPIFNIYRADSEVRRWQETRDVDVEVSPELMEVLVACETWTLRTRGTFQPASEAFTQLWRLSAESGEVLDDRALLAVATEMEKPLWHLDRMRLWARRLTRLPIALNSIAKGFIIDSAARRASQVEGVHAVLVNVGGDLRHIGDKPVSVDIAHPFADAENAEPIASVRIEGQALATSGSYRRGFQVGEKWLSHVIDPRSGRPIEHTVSASVIAPSAMVADVLATACSVLTPPESVRLADFLPDVGVLIVEQNGATICNVRWQQHVVSQAA